MKKYYLLLSLLVIVGLMLSLDSIVSGQRRTQQRAARRGPTLKQTLQWLSQNLPLLLANVPQRRGFEPISFRDCTLIYRTAKKSDVLSEVEKKPVWITLETTLNLSRLDPDSAEPAFLEGGEGKLGNERFLGPWYISLQTADQKPTIRNVEISETGAPTGDFWDWPAEPFSFDDEESALRVAKAFRRAITLCGGKRSKLTNPDLFTAAVEWKVIASSDGYRFYYNTRTMKRSSNGATEVWLRRVLVDKFEEERKKLSEELASQGLTTKGYDKYSNSVDLQQYDCSKRKVRTLSSRDYDETGAVLLTLTSTDIEKWISVVPDSIGDATLRAVCKRR